MMIDSALYPPTTIFLELRASDQDEAWTKSRHLSNTRSCWRAYINHLCYLTLLHGLPSELPTIRPRFALPSMQSIWEFINGIEFQQGSDSYLFLPVETVDQGSVSVPQEWVTIPSWMAQYYCPVDINLEEGYLALMGYVTHDQILTLNLERDRTYQLEMAWLKDWTVLTVAQDLELSDCSPHAEPLTPLSISQAQSLIGRLGNAAMKFPQLEIPISQWNALLSHGGWRQALAAERWGEAPSRSLGTWLRRGVPDWFRDLGWESLTTQSMAGARGEAITPENLCSRRLSIEGEPFELIMAALPEHEQSFRFELRSLKLGAFIPQDYRLRLLTADLQPFDNNEAIASNPIEVLQVDVMLAPDDVVVWEISPTPDQFDYECFTA